MDDRIRGVQLMIIISFRIKKNYKCQSNLAMDLLRCVGFRGENPGGRRESQGVAKGSSWVVVDGS